MRRSIQSLCVLGFCFKKREKGGTTFAKASVVEEGQTLRLAQCPVIELTSAAYTSKPINL